MLNQLHFLFVWSAKGTRGQQSRPAFARGLNHVPNTPNALMSFGRRVATLSPLTAASNAFRRANWPAHFYAVLLTGILALALAGCGGGGGGGGVTPTPVENLPVSDIQTAVSGNNITVSWTNPAQENITGFTIDWVNVANDVDGDTKEFNPPDANVSAGASVTYKIMRLTYDATYNITVAVRYAGRDPAVSAIVQVVIGADPNSGDDPLPANNRAVADIQTEVSGNTITVSWTNPAQEGITGFNVSWVNAADGSDANSTILGNETTPAVNISSGASDNTYTITDLAYDTTYEITVTVFYIDGTSAVSDPEQATIGKNPDSDNDGVADADDADDDGDGLIEIRTLDELARLRGDLNGDGMDDNDTDEITVEESMGCPVAGCIGYELTRSLDFSDVSSYANENSPNMVAWTESAGWTPIGSCTNADTCESYSGVFEGNNHNISNLFISFVDDDVFGVGLFGAFSGSIRNLGLLNASVKVSNANGTSGTSSGTSVGGLIGNGDDAEISHSYMTAGSVSGRDHVGGLIGNGDDAEISHSYMTAGSVSGRDRVGGLIGNGDDAEISHSYMTAGSVSGKDRVGGLIGSGEESKDRSFLCERCCCFGCR